MEQYLIMLGSGILLVLGTIHLGYTFFTDKLNPRNAWIMGLMKNEFPVLTSGTTLWKAWTGFNASHSAGIIFFALVNIYLISNFPEVLQNVSGLLLLDDIYILYYLYLAKKYWFRTPFIGVLAALICYLTFTVLINI